MKFGFLREPIEPVVVEEVEEGSCVDFGAWRERLAIESGPWGTEFVEEFAWSVSELGSAADPDDFVFEIAGRHSAIGLEGACVGGMRQNKAGP